MPRRSGHPQGSGEVLERDRGSKSPVSFQPPLRGANKIYTYDVVFRIGEANTKPISPTQLPYRQEKSKNPSRLKIQLHPREEEKKIAQRGNLVI